MNYDLQAKEKNARQAQEHVEYDLSMKHRRQKLLSFALTFASCLEGNASVHVYMSYSLYSCKVGDTGDYEGSIKGILGV